jgi:hypothetical protein
MGRLNLGATLCAILLVIWIVVPAFTYHKGTSENISAEVIKEPFVESPVLVYRWKGDVVRACAVEIRRKITSSDGVVTTLIPTSLSKPPASELRHHDLERRIQVPELIAEGPAIYQATEVPACNWLQRAFPIEVPYPPVEFEVTR